MSPRTGQSWSCEPTMCALHVHVVTPMIIYGSMALPMICILSKIFNTNLLLCGLYMEDHKHTCSFNVMNIPKRTFVAQIGCESIAHISLDECSSNWATDSSLKCISKGLNMAPKVFVKYRNNWLCFTNRRRSCRSIWKLWSPWMTESKKIYCIKTSIT